MSTVCTIIKNTNVIGNLYKMWFMKDSIKEGQHSKIIPKN